VQVVRFSYPGVITFLNDGNIDVYVLDALVTEAEQSQTVRINTVVKVRETATFRTPDSERLMVAAHSAEPGFRMSNAMGLTVDGNTIFCAEPLYATESDDMFAMARKSFGDELVTSDANVEIRYVGVNGETSLRMPLKAMLSVDPNCREILERNGLKKMWTLPSQANMFRNAD
jgi:hypothetical protein